jgi:hypothetical protein
MLVVMLQTRPKSPALDQSDSGTRLQSFSQSVAGGLARTILTCIDRLPELLIGGSAALLLAKQLQLPRWRFVSGGSEELGDSVRTQRRHAFKIGLLVIP